MGFKGVGDILITETPHSELELRFWTGDAGSPELPQSELVSLRTSIDDPDGDGSQEVDILSTANGSSKFNMGGYGEIKVVEDFQSAAWDATADGISSPADIRWVFVYDTSTLKRVAHGYLSTAVAVADGNPLLIKSGTVFKMGYPSGDEIPPDPSNPTTYTLVNPGLAQAIFDALSDGTNISWAGATYDKMRIEIQGTFGGVADTSPQSSPQDISMTGFDNTDSNEVTVTDSEGRVSIDFTNHPDTAGAGVEFTIQDSEAPWSVDYVQLTLLESGTEPVETPFLLKQYSSFPTQDYGTAFLLKTFDAVA